MEQLSLPFRIVLLAVAVFGVVWFVALKPGTTPAPKTAPGVAGLSNATKAAHAAVAQSVANAAAVNAADGSTPAAASTAKAPAAKTPGGASATPSKAQVVTDRSAPILADLAKGRVAVVAFSGNQAADDLGVRLALKGINRHHGKVVVRSVPIGDVADYGAITQGVQVQQSPTVIVVGKNHKAHSIVGFTDVNELNQLIGDVGGKGF